MKQTAVTVAVMGFFVLAGVGWLAGLSPFECGLKALIGGAALYILTTMAGRMVVNVMVRTIMSATADSTQQDEDTSGEPTQQ